MWTIDKQFSCCYGHRVYVQKLNQEYTGDDCQAKCRHLHGHEGLIHVFLEAEKLNDQSMVTDFKHLGWLKNFIDNTLDHKFVIDFNDPMFRQLVMQVYLSPLTELTVEQFLNGFTTPVYVPGTNHAVGRVLSRDGRSTETPQYEILEGYLIVNFVPTSENLAKWMFDIVNVKMMKLGVKTSRIDWFETPKSRSTYYGS
jgi:6-pyruvoyltetrahydropterin/6-carboxytetrahydropterin synthase